ncbi:MAG: hypothetical protein SWJ54_17645 [Cyanobacteriota bacterium]|nr:hypothetical protein [Cyanobacteriota bacterium]
MDTYGLLLPEKYTIEFSKVQKVSSRIFCQEVNGDFKIVQDPFTGMFNDGSLAAVINKRVDIELLPNIAATPGMLYGPVVFCKLDPSSFRLTGLTRPQVTYLKRIKKLFLYTDRN